MPSRFRLALWNSIPWLPALVLLVLIWRLHVGVPFYDSWWFVDAYHAWQKGEYTLTHLFATHGPHPSVPGKLVYWCAMHLAHGDVSWLPFVSWALTLGAALACAAMIRETCRNNERTRWWLVLLANTCFFSTAQGSTWLWDFLFQNLILSLCLPLSLWCLTRPEKTPVRIACAGAVAALAAISFGSGFLVIWLILPMVWLRMQNEPAGKRTAWIAGTVVLALLLTWLAMVLMPSLGQPSVHDRLSQRAESLAARPATTIAYLLAVLGAPLAHGTSVDKEGLAMIVGALFSGLLVVTLVRLWRQRGDHSLHLVAYPWLAFVAFAVLNAVMIALARMGQSIGTAMVPRYIMYSLFFEVGVCVLFATTLARSPGGSRKWIVPGMAVLLALQALNWIDGVQSMRLFHSQLEQNRAALSFANVLPLWPDRVIQHNGNDSIKKSVNFLASQGRLRGVKLLEDTALSNFRSSGVMGSRGSHFDLVGRRSDGNLIAEGVCAGGNLIGELPDLILITAAEPQQPERIIAFQFPIMPTDYFADAERRHDYQEHYFGWRVTLDQAPVPSSPNTVLRAYAYDGERRVVRRISGEFPVPP